MTKKIDDPDFGTIEVPDFDVSDEERARNREALIKKMRGQRLFPTGTTTMCPMCRKETFEGRDDLSAEVRKEHTILIFRRLSGARCRNCHAQTLEPYEEIDIEREAGFGAKSDYEAKVSRIGSGSLGTYWPKDVTRVMGLHPHDRVFISVLDRDTALLRIQHPEGESSAA